MKDHMVFWGPYWVPVLRATTISVMSVLEPDFGVL